MGSGPTEVVRYAQQLTERGYACYPVNVEYDGEDKHPSFKDGKWRDGEYPTDPDQIAQHWSGFSGIAINTGRSGIVVIDVDTSNGKDGFAALAAAGIEIPDTPLTVTSWSGGMHFYYRQGDMLAGTSQSKLAKGVDTRGVGGIVFAPPTEIGGVAYLFNESVPPVSDLPVFPAGLAASLACSERLPVDRDALFELPVVPDLVPAETELCDQRYSAALGGIRAGEDGQRNAALGAHVIPAFDYGFKLGYGFSRIADDVRAAYYASDGKDSAQLEGHINTGSRRAAQHPGPVPTNDRSVRTREILEESKARADANAVLSRAEHSDDWAQPLVRTDANRDRSGYIGGLVPFGGKVVVHGKPGSGKSLSVLDWVLHVASGRSWHGRPVHRAQVVYFVGEGKAGFLNRADSWREANGVAAGDLDGWYIPMQGVPYVDDPSTLKRANAFLRSIEPGVVVVDTLSLATDPERLGKSSAAPMRAVFTELVAGIPEASVIVLHHPPTGNGEKPGGGGGSQVLGMADVSYRVYVDDVDDRHVYVEKNRDGKDHYELGQFAPAPYGASVVARWAAVDGDVRYSRAEQPFD